MFEIYTKEVQIKDSNGNVNTYKLRPLNGNYLKKLFTIMASFNNVSSEKELTLEERNKKVFEALSGENISILHELLLETLKKSYPKENEEQLNEFVSQNLLSFMDALIEVNLPNNE